MGPTGFVETSVTTNLCCVTYQKSEDLMGKSCRQGIVGPFVHYVPRPRACCWSTKCDRRFDLLTECHENLSDCEVLRFSWRFSWGFRSCGILICPSVHKHEFRGQIVLAFRVLEKKSLNFSSQMFMAKRHCSLQQEIKNKKKHHGERQRNQ